MATALEQLAQDILTCCRCDRLVEWRRTTSQSDWVALPVPGFGDPAARILVVGLAPSRRGANAHGRMFTGDPSAAFLTAALWRLGLANQPTSTSRDDGLVLTDVWLSAAARCAPPDNRPRAGELAACRPYLVRELELVPWRSAVALGAIAWSALAAALGEPLGRFRHGERIELGRGRLVLASYHPSPQNTAPRRLTPAMLDTVLADALAHASAATT